MSDRCRYCGNPPGPVCDSYSCNMQANEEDAALYPLMTVEGTARFVAEAHDGQIDKAGMPYVLHPLRVGASLWEFGPDYVIAGMLHDVVEDTPYELSDLNALGAPPAVVRAVDLVTKHASESRWEVYEQTIKRAMADPMARAVKVADVSDNASRLGGVIDPVVADRLSAKYVRAEALIRVFVPGYRRGGRLSPTMTGLTPP